MRTTDLSGATIEALIWSSLDLLSYAGLWLLQNLLPWSTSFIELFSSHTYEGLREIKGSSGDQAEEVFESLCTRV